MTAEQIVIRKFAFKIINKNNLIYVKGSHHRIKVPILDGEFAIFLGLLWGDGCITNRKLAEVNGNWRISIVEDDKVLSSYLIDLIGEIFSIKAKIFYYDIKYDIHFNSRIVYEVLNKEFNFPDGEKKDRLHIPKQVLKDKYLSKMFLRGLFSTDGCITFSNNYPRISVSSASYEFIKEIEKLLKNLYFNPKLNVYNRKVGNKLYNIRLNGFYQTILFSKEIGFVGDKKYKLEKYLAAP